MTKSIIPGWIFLVFSLLFTFWGTKIPPSPYSNMAVGPAVFPIAIGIALSIASIALIITGIIGRRIDSKNNVVESTPKEQEEDYDVPDKHQDSRKLMIILAILLVYLLLFVPLGYMLSTFLFILGLTMYLERKRWRRNVIYSIAFPVLIYILFNNVLSVYLPTGPFG